MATDLDRLAVWALAPALGLGGAIAAMLLLAPFAGHPMWRTRTLNMSEAAAARDVATVALLLERGEDPNAPRPVRAALLDGAGGERTPLEAAVAAGRLEVVDVLLAGGAVVGDQQRAALVCQALDRGYRDVAEYLVRPAAPACPR